ncbi:Metacaspase 9 [Zostera marina]|uniref:Metacaspase 9 n=1 Tax=Zostera marina TaxID=29655 RepID=A0A0K9PHB3_ZOSMR|nr:Metacaspase 9 [Zostera marina]
MDSGGRTERKKAVICGISYQGTNRELKGCINDANCMKYLLITKFHFLDSNIIMLTEEETDSSRIPTKRNIRSAMRWLVEDCRPGDSLVFHYSGHGSQEEDIDGDEIDGYDETICPLDYKTNGMIIDDEINYTIVRPLPRGVKLHAIIDACHSGTVLDLPYLCRMNRDGRYEWEDHRPRTGVWKGTNGGQVFSFSGCDDHQVSTDTEDFSKTTTTGAMTYSFIQAIERGEATTYGSLLTSMRTMIRYPHNQRSAEHRLSALLCRLMQRLAGTNFNQEPQLTSNETFDVFLKSFSI